MKFLSAALAVMLLWVATAAGRGMEPHIQRGDFPAVKTLHNVTYGVADGVKLKMDIYLPAQERKKDVPVILSVHGGAWRVGGRMTKNSPLLAILLRHGYAVVPIDYRLAPRFKFPAQIEDCKCAVRFLRAHAKLLHIDPNRIGAMGESAGGHLVALLGLTGPSAGFDGNGGWQNESSSVQAVADLFGPSDLTDWDTNGHEEYVWTEEHVFGAVTGSDPLLKRASPVNYISPNAPPFFILHGDLDNVVPVSQSIELYNKLKAAGDPATLMIVTNFGHGEAPPRLMPKPSEKHFTEAIADFFDWNLKK
ncbi:MAG TPA: alpha/beta hydrolase [Verrucomicrobiae bacterium]|nr:alpha/beta hydrolase [Verrucomicrobiae bacterium]